MEAKATFLSLVGKREEWYVSYPPSDRDPTSPSKQSYHVTLVTTSMERELQDTVFSTIALGIDRMFSTENPKVLYNKTFWDARWEEATFSLFRALGFVQYYNSKPGAGAAEAELRLTLFTPLLKVVTNSASMMLAKDRPGEEGLEYASSFSVEVAAEERRHMPGRKPEVDYLISGFIDVDLEPLYVIPVEARRLHTQSDIGQLCQYVSMLSVCGYHNISNIAQGMIIDSHTIRFAFGCLSLEDGSPLPIILVSPAVPWRYDNSINKAVFVAMCMFHIFSAKRHVIAEDVDKWQHSFGAGLWKRMVAIARKLSEKMYIPRRSLSQEFNVLDKIASLQKEVAELREIINSPPRKVPKH